MTPAPVTPSNPTPSAATPKVENIPGHADLIKRQEELERKEAELDRRERQMNSGGGASSQPNNWPPLPSWVPIKPCFYHDISLEIPLDFQKIVRYLYYLWMIYVLALFVNVLGNMPVWITVSQMNSTSTDSGTVHNVSENAAKNFGLSIIWLVIFSTCSMCWYIPAYKAFKTDSSFNFFIFFFIFFFQICWLLLMVIGIPGMGFCGWTIAITGLKTNVAGGIVAMIAALLFTVTFIFGIVML